MKDIKSYVIGFLTCACLFLIMGQTDADHWKTAALLMQEEGNKVGRYQGYRAGTDFKENISTYYIVDTKTGQTFEHKVSKKKGFHWVEKTPKAGESIK